MPDFTISRSQVFASLPPLWPHDVLPEIRHSVSAAARRKLVVLDDDPTGTQTVHDIVIVTQWDVDTLRRELDGPAAGFYILTNSRALPPPAARALTVEIARNLREAAAAAECEFALASRSDSTLRGHFPIETDALGEVCGPFDATLLLPYFEAGGRYTISDTHYVAEDDALVPAGETPFARDAAFGYRHSNLRSWVEEKTAGQVPAAAVHSVSLELIRHGGPQGVRAALLAAPRGSVVIVNAAAPRDIEVVALASLQAEAAGRRLLFRTAASFVAARLGLVPQPPLDPSALTTGTRDRRGGLIIAGSYVPKTTAQLERLIAARTVQSIELDVESVVNPTRGADVIAKTVKDTNAALAQGKDTLVFTSRRLISAESSEVSLQIGAEVSRALVAIVQGLTTVPRFLVAKGGITSSDIATRGLGVRRAIVLGQLIPGVPVWQLGPEAKFPGLHYVVFPGNVGGPDALAEAVARLST